MKAVETLLSELGLEESKINELINADENYSIDDISSSLKSNISSQLKNSSEFWNELDEKNIPPAFMKKIESQQYGRAANIVRQNLLKGLGMSEKDFADLGEDAKKIEVFSKELSKRLASGKVNDQTIQKELIEAREKIEELENSIPGIREEVSKKIIDEYNNEKINLIILSELSLVGGLKVPPKYIADKISDTLKNEYHINLNGNSAELRQKENPQLKVLAGSKEVTLRDAIVNFLKNDSLIEESGSGSGNPPGKGRVTLEVGGSNGFSLGHLNDKIKSRLIEEQKVGR